MRANGWDSPSVLGWTGSSAFVFCLRRMPNGGSLWTWTINKKEK